MSEQTITILFEDAWLLAIDKPSGLLVHELTLAKTKIQDPPRPTRVETGSSPKIQKTTVVEWFTEKYPETKNLDWPDASRPGIVHRLDRDTSGVLILAKTPEVLIALQKQFAGRNVQKTYLALVAGAPEWDEKTVRAAVSREEGTRRRAGYFVAPGDRAKIAETHFTILTRFRRVESGIWNLESGEKIQDSKFQSHTPSVSLVEAKPLTGRTHQIRVHLGLEGYPILGDSWYQTKHSRDLARQLHVPRLMLHAQKLIFTHPTTQTTILVEAQLPNDLKGMLHKLKKLLS